MTLIQNGLYTEIESDFKKCLGELIPLLLAPENLVVKQIGGQKVKAKELMQYFKSYINMYKGNDLPEPKSMLMVRNFLIIIHLKPSIS